jgi:hypothetical protein
METTTFIQLSTLPNYIKNGSLYQELQKSRSTDDDVEGNESVASDDFNAYANDSSGKHPRCVRKDDAEHAASKGIVYTFTSAFRAGGEVSNASATSTTTTTVSTATEVEEPYLSFPAQYCRFDVAAALANELPVQATATVKVGVEPGSTAAAAANTAAGAFCDQALPASVLGAVGVMSTLRYWGVEDELPLELVRYLLESEELSSPSSSSFSTSSVSSLSLASSKVLEGVGTNIDADSISSSSSAAAQAAPPQLLPDLITYLAGEHREGDMFGFLLDLQQLRGMSTVQRLEYAASKGYLPLLRAVHKMLEKPLWTKKGLTCVKYAEAGATKRINWDFPLSRIAAIHGQLQVLQFLHEDGYPLDVIICYWAAKGGNWRCLQYAHEHGFVWEATTCSIAADGGHLDCLQYAHEHGCPWNAGTCSYAAYSGHLDCLQYAHEHGCAWCSETCFEAAEGGHLDCLQYAHEHGCPWDGRTGSSAASGGHLDCLQYAHEHGCPWDAGTCSYAAKGGHLDCLQYAHERGCLLVDIVCYYAARGGHLDCLQYAHEHRCTWDALTCSSAAEGGHLDCLQYAHEHGCPLDLTWCIEVARGDCVVYLNPILAAAECTYS